MRRLIHLHQPRDPAMAALKAGLCGGVAIALVAWLGYRSGAGWLVAPFGGTCVLLFSLPKAAFSQPANVIGGHVVSTAAGLAVAWLAPVEWWSLGLAVGLAIAAMHLLRVTHPPAGADPLVVLLTVPQPGYQFLFFPVLAGSVLLVLCALALRRLPPRVIYPLAVSTKDG